MRANITNDAYLDVITVWYNEREDWGEDEYAVRSLLRPEERVMQ